MLKTTRAKILGIDPGFARAGWGVINKDGSKLELVDYGCFESEQEKDLNERLHLLATCLRKIIKKYKPEVMVVEELFFFKNLKTAINVAQARGVIILVAHEERVPIVELTPLEIKQSISGYGRADKVQVQRMVKIILKLDKIPQPDDAADALAIAISGAAYWPKRF